MTHNLAGQWVGQSVGDPNGQVILDLDDRGRGWTGTAYLHPDTNQLPPSLASIEIPPDYEAKYIDAPTRHYDASVGRILRLDELASFFPDVNFPNSCEFCVEALGDGSLKFEWRTDAGTEGKGILKQILAPSRSIITASEKIRTWADFKLEVERFSFGSYIFRGQAQPWPLQTTFHRSRRKDLNFYLQDDLPRLHRKLTGRTKHIFDLEKPLQLGAFMNLIQHHGYPTPLLDWTYSPFVAAWFAFSNLSENNKMYDRVRIFSLNKSELLKLSQFQSLTLAPPHLSLLEALSIENNRALPQQGTLTLTNLADIEGHVQNLERSEGVSMLSAYDLPFSEAEVALNDLAMMGITQSTLFPGIDSICRDQRRDAFP